MFHSNKNTIPKLSNEKLNSLLKNQSAKVQSFEERDDIQAEHKLLELVEILIHKDPRVNGVLNYIKNPENTKLIALEENEFHDFVQSN